MSSSTVETVKKYYDKEGPTYDDYSRQLWSKVYDAVTWKITEPYVPKNSRAVVFDAVVELENGQFRLLDAVQE